MVCFCSSGSSGLVGVPLFFVFLVFWWSVVWVWGVWDGGGGREREKRKSCHEREVRAGE